MGETISAVLLDLDETILYDELATEAAFSATATHAAEIAAVDPGCLIVAVQEEARALWLEGPDPAWCDDIGTSEVEGLRARFEGNDPRTVAMRAWGPGFRSESWKRALRRCGIDDDMLASELDARFEQERVSTNPFIPGVEETLDQLEERYRLAIVTNGLPDVQREKLVRTGLMDRFDVVVISGELGFGKPDRRMYDETVRQLRLIAGECVMVGDNFRRDVAGAQEAGIRGVWISCGKDLPDTDVTPFLVVESLAELPSKLASCRG
ncbi:MAG TPA: HAD family hydrolase [Thermomicrobiales bacterium]|nr:HAD family hydrolase [Thermomicrobiales bacterium]